MTDITAYFCWRLIATDKKGNIDQEFCIYHSSVDFKVNKIFYNQIFASRDMEVSSIVITELTRNMKIYQYVYEFAVVVLACLINIYFKFIKDILKITLPNNIYLKSGRTPINELYGTFCFDGSNGRIDVFGHYVSSVQKTARHVLSMSWIAFNHLVCGLKACICDLSNSQLLVICLLRRYHWSVSYQGKVNPWIRNEVGLEFGQVDIQCTVESQGSCDGGYYLADKSVKIRICWSLDVQVASTDVIDGLVVHHESTVRVLQSGMGSKNGIVRLYDGGRNLKNKATFQFMKLNYQI